MTTPRMKAGPSLVRLLGELPKLDARRREAFRSAFTDAQCDAWGIQTRAPRVLTEASRWIFSMAPAVRSAEGVHGYSPARLAWLTECAIALEAELERTSAVDATAVRARRSGAVRSSLRTRKTLAHVLRQVAGGDETLRAEISARLGSGVGTLRRLTEGLPSLIELAARWLKDERLRLLAEDAGLTAARLEAARAESAALARAIEEASALTPGGRDTPRVNRLEGRVLRELAHASRAFKHAAEQGQVVPRLVPGQAIRAVFSRHVPRRGAAGLVPVPVPVARERRPA